MKKPKVTKAADYRLIENDPDFSYDAFGPMNIDGTLFFAGRDIMVSTLLPQPDGAGFVAVFIGRPIAGIYMQMTAHGAREFAGAMVRAAAEADAFTSEAADKMLRATLAKDPPA